MGHIGPSQELRKAILGSIRNEEVRRARMYLASSIATASASVFGIVVSIQYVIQALQQSSFFSYASLALSDSDMLFALWREFALSLVETLPFLGVTLLLVAVAVLLGSVRVMVNTARSRLRFSLTG